MSNFLYMHYGSSIDEQTHDTKNFFVYKTPDGTIWINKDKDALQRMRNHFVVESDNIITRLEAEKQQVLSYNILKPEVQEMLATSYNLNSETKQKTQIWNNRSANFLVLNSLIIVSGFLFFYLIARKSRSVIADEEVEQEVISEPINAKKIMSNTTTNSVQVINKAKDIICEILQIINKYSDNRIVPKNKDLDTFITNHTQEIKASSTLEAFTNIKGEINRAIPPHLERARDLIKVKFDELKSLINELGKDFESITNDNTNFTGQINNSISIIEKTIELDEIKEIRKRMTDEIGIVRETIKRKQDRDIKVINMLSCKVRTLDNELVSAKEETLIDGLTQLYNRKAFDRKLKEAFENNSMQKNSFALIMGDIDYFKKLNDDYSHTVGDEALKKVANSIKEAFRLNDFVARYGGEEFIVIVDNINRRSVINLCERVRTNIESLNFKIEDETIPISISIGVAFCKESDTPETLLNRADKSLYLAKQSGRNLVKTEEQLAETELQTVEQ